MFRPSAFIVVLSVTVCTLLVSITIHDSAAYCVVVDGGSQLNGYYMAIDGVYRRVQHNFVYMPDIFDLLRLNPGTLRSSSTSATIELSKQAWTIKLGGKYPSKAMYENRPSDPENYLFQPPPQGWIPTGDAEQPSLELPSSSSSSFSSLELIEATPKVLYCRGSLADSYYSGSTISGTGGGGSSNLATLMNRPVTTTLLLVILYFAYVLYSQRVDVARVSYSYKLAVAQKQYWRMVTASFSHFDVLHLAFNTMSLYQLGILEETYGSFTFAYLSFDLVFITMIIASAIYFTLITRYGRADLYEQQAVGYSCVLFAWMVAMSVRMQNFCPIFVFPSFCFDTWSIPVPSIGAALRVLQSIVGGTDVATTTKSNANAIEISGLPINLGPIVLLLFTKILIPRSSFIGHLAGIIIGYPLAWNLLEWITPPVMCSLLCFLYLVHHSYGELINITNHDNNINNNGNSVYTTNTGGQGALLVWRFPGYNAQGSSSAELHNFLTLSQQRTYWSLWFLFAFLAILITPAYLFFFGGLFSRFVTIALPQLLLLFLVWSSVQARRVIWAADHIHAVVHDCITLILLTVGYLFLQIVYAVGNAGGLAACFHLLTGGMRAAPSAGSAEGDYLAVEFATGAMYTLIAAIIVESAIALLLVISLYDCLLSTARLAPYRLDQASVKEDFNLCRSLALFPVRLVFGRPVFGRNAHIVPFSGPARTLSGSIGTSNSSSSGVISNNRTADVGAHQSGILASLGTYAAYPTATVTATATAGRSSHTVASNGGPVAIPFPLIPDTNTTALSEQQQDHHHHLEQQQQTQQQRQQQQDQLPYATAVCAASLSPPTSSADLS